VPHPTDESLQRQHAVTRDVVIRAAVPADRDLVLRWANDPVTRTASFHPEPIVPQVHATWYAARLADPNGRLWIAEVDGCPVGQLRAERSLDGTVELGISVAPEARGRGLARPMLRAGMTIAAGDLRPTSFVAVIRLGNAVSLAVFRGEGFAEVARTERGGLPGLVLVRNAAGDA
jgi:RimJ/RimL family protein N-acetyltransferase